MSDYSKCAILRPVFSKCQLSELPATRIVSHRKVTCSKSHLVEVPFRRSVARSKCLSGEVPVIPRCCFTEVSVSRSVALPKCQPNCSPTKVLAELLPRSASSCSCRSCVAVVRFGESPDPHHPPAPAIIDFNQLRIQSTILRSESSLLQVRAMTPFQPDRSRLCSRTFPVEATVTSSSNKSTYVIRLLFCNSRVSNRSTGGC